MTNLSTGNDAVIINYLKNFIKKFLYEVLQTYQFFYLVKRQTTTGGILSTRIVLIALHHTSKLQLFCLFLLYCKQDLSLSFILSAFKSWRKNFRIEFMFLSCINDALTNKVPKSSCGLKCKFNRLNHHFKAKFCINFELS